MLLALASCSGSFRTFRPLKLDHPQPGIMGGKKEKAKAEKIDRFMIEIIQLIALIVHQKNHASSPIFLVITHN